MSALNVRTLIGFVVTLSALPAVAQNGAITGRVTEAGSDRGIASAGVRVLAGEKTGYAYTERLAGVVDVPIYPTLLTSQVGYILRDSGSRIVFRIDTASSV